MTSEIQSKQPCFDEISNVTKELKELCQEDIDEMLSEFQDTEKNWNDVNKLLQARQEDMEHMESKLMEFDMKDKYCGETIGQLRKALESENVTCINSEKLREVKDNFEKIRKKVADLHPSVETVETLSDELESRHVNSDVSAVKQKAEGTRDEYEKLKKMVDEKISDLEDTVKELEDVESRAGKMAEKMEDAAKKIDQNKPRKMIVEELAMQAEDVKVGLVIFRPC